MKKCVTEALIFFHFKHQAKKKQSYNNYNVPFLNDYNGQCNSTL